MRTLFNKGWWRSFFDFPGYGWQANLVADGEFVGDREEWMVKTNQADSVFGYDGTYDGLSFYYEPGPSALIGRDTFKDEDLWGFQIDVFYAPFNIPARVDNDCFFAVMSDEYDKELEQGNFEDNVLFSIELGTKVADWPIRITKRDLSGSREWWNGSAWQGTEASITPFSASIDTRRIRAGIRRVSEDVLIFYLWEATDPINTDTWELRADVRVEDGDFQKNKGAWFFFGRSEPIDPVDQYSFMLVREVWRMKGVKSESIPMTDGRVLPPYLKFEQSNRSKTTTFNRTNFNVVLRDGSNTFLPSLRKVTVEESNRDLYHTIKSGEEGRLDLVSYRNYGTTRLWWVLAMVNDIDKPFSVPPGTVLRVPPMDLVDELSRQIGEEYGR